MAEEEKIEAHAKKALRILTNRKKKWKEKIKDFLWEILIIIVGVSITLWFHNWSDRRQERKEVKQFLIDVRENLIEDTSKIKANINFMTNGPLVYYDSVLYQINHHKIDAKYIDSNTVQLLNNYSANFDYSIFQSFSSAGNLRLIENRKLLGDIVTLYSSELPNHTDNDQYITNNRHDTFEKYIGSKLGIDSNASCKLSTIIYQPEIKYLIQWGDIVIKEQNRHEGNSVNGIVAVIHEIDKELKDNFNYEVTKTKK